MARAVLFVSSVQKELAQERQAIREFVQADALLRRFFAVFLFEDLPAADRRANEVYLEQVDRCEVFVSLLGDEYGREDEDGLSPTEREFERATQAGKPRLVFVRGAEAPARHPKMAALVRKVGDQLIRRRFQDVAELTAGLYASLVEHLERTKRLQTRPFDASACPGAESKDLSSEQIDLFLDRARSQRGYALGPGTPYLFALVHLNLFDGDRLTHAALLLYGKRPQSFLPSSEVKCMHFHGTEVAKPIPSYQVYKGTVFQLVDQAVDFVMSKLDRAVGTRAEGTQAPVEYELPREAVTEAIVNAVVHRDYASPASVQVMLFADRLEVWNPGELPVGLSIEGLARPHASIPRNPLIAEPMFLARYVEKAGSGILDMIARCRDAGLPAPWFWQDGGQFVQALGRPTASGVTSGVTPEAAPEVRLARVLVGEMTRQQLREALGLKDDEHFRKAYLGPALEAGLIERTIPDKPRSPIQSYRLARRGGPPGTEKV
jgi:ATP-dependent DNA helicase RecG